MFPKRTTKRFLLVSILTASIFPILFYFFGSLKSSKTDHKQVKLLDLEPDLEVVPINNILKRKQLIFPNLSNESLAIPNLPAKLNTNLSEEAGKCLPSHSPSLLQKYFKSSNNLSFPIFVNDNYTSWKNIFLYPPPFGFKDVGNTISKLLKLLPSSELPETLKSSQCKRCIVVGNGGILNGKKLGNKIDSYDFVLRLNDGPTKGFEVDVGRKTDIRMVYPESAPRVASTYDPNALLLIATFKPLDLEWLRAVVTHSKVPQGGFWKKIAESVPTPSKNIRIVNPLLLQTLSFELIGNKDNGGKMSHNVPTAGTSALFMLLNQSGCDQVDAIGFGFTKSNPHQRMHYFDRTEMGDFVKLWTHDITSEKAFLQALVKHDIIQDLTGGIYWV